MNLLTEIRRLTAVKLVELAIRCSDEEVVDLCLVIADARGVGIMKRPAPISEEAVQRFTDSVQHVWDVLFAEAMPGESGLGPGSALGHQAYSPTGNSRPCMCSIGKNHPGPFWEEM